jgi:predicted AlkP superfamily pyrophosphatase or phosphodiesterase
MKNSRNMKRKIAVIVGLVLLTVVSLESAQRPKLVLYISIDQMKAEYLDQFRRELTGGLKRLATEGTVFTNADLNYAPSETGPGHAALGTGSYPSKSGILSNEWVDLKTQKEVYCVEDSTAEKAEAEGGGVSPKHLLVTALGDWLRQASPDSKVIAMSIKDRAAILMGGQRPNFAFWYSRKSGHMVTSDYYTRDVPEWAKSFNGKDWIQQNVPESWTRLRPESVYARYGPDELEGEMKWGGSTAFPHRFEAEQRREQIVTSPYGDMMTLDFAREAVRSEKLGQRGVTDLLLISLSCTDYVGHAFGPNSQEMADQMIRLDRSLGSFIADIEKGLGRGNILVALSADHAILPLPEYMTTIQRKIGRRILPQKEINPKIEEFDQTLQREFGTTEHIIRSDAFLNYAAAARANVDSVALEHRVKEGLLKIDGIADVYFRRELMNGKSPDRPYLGKYQRGYFPPRGKDFLIRPCEYCLITTSSTGTSHGSPYRYDTHVAMVFWGKGIKSQKVSREVHTVDIAPTIAQYLGLSYPATVDGKPLREIVQ